MYRCWKTQEKLPKIAIFPNITIWGGGGGVGIGAVIQPVVSMPGLTNQSEEISAKHLELNLKNELEETGK